MTDTTSETNNKTNKEESPDVRMIKKYPNRRLYDTAISSYITLEDVKRLVMDQVAIKVIDARSGTDITHNTLLQIILDQEESGPPLFTTDLLQKMIRFYGDSMQNMFGKMFEQGMKFFTEQQSAWQSGVMSQTTSQMQADEPMKFMSEFTKNNVEQWQQFQQMWLQNFQRWAKSVQPEHASTEPHVVCKDTEYSDK